MIIVTSKELLDQEIETVLYTREAFAFRGTGLFTSICVAFANFFGAASTKYADKMSKAINSAKDSLVRKAELLHADAIVDYRIVHLGNAVCVYGTPVIFKKNQTAKELPSTKKIDEIKREVKNESSNEANENKSVQIKTIEETSNCKIRIVEFDKIDGTTIYFKDNSSINISLGSDFEVIQNKLHFTFISTKYEVNFQTEQQAKSIFLAIASEIS